MTKQRLLLTLLFTVAAFIAGCETHVGAPDSPPDAKVAAATPLPEPTAVPKPAIPKLQAELLDDRNKTTEAPIGKFDFRNFSFPLPRGWENPDGSEITLENGRREPVIVDTNVDSSDEERLLAKADRRIGMSYVTTKFLDVNGDGIDEAIVILKIETAGSAIPQIGYIYTWKDDKPELMWTFRTGDRADGGLKDVRIENGLLVVEMFGQDRFLLGQMETGKITGDYEQLCCPSYFTRTAYKWNGKAFVMQGKRLTYSIADPNAAPVENMGEIVNNPSKKAKK